MHALDKKRTNWHRASTYKAHTHISKRACFLLVKRYRAIRNFVTNHNYMRDAPLQFLSRANWFNTLRVMVFVRARALRGRTKIIIAAVNCHDECAESNDRQTGITITSLRGISLSVFPFFFSLGAYKVRSLREPRPSHSRLGSWPFEVWNCPLIGSSAIRGNK